MPAKAVAGNVSKLAIGESGVTLVLDDEPESYSVPTRHANYNALVSGLMLASANSFRVDLKTETDGRTVSLLQIHP